MCAVVHALEKKLAFVGDERCVQVPSLDLVDFVMNQVVFQVSWSGLIYFGLVEHVSLFFDRSQCELNLRVSAHASPPNKDFATLRQDHCVVESRININDIYFLLSILLVLKSERSPLIWVYLYHDIFSTDTQSTVVVVAPGVHLSLCRQESGKAITASDLNYRYVERYLEWHRWHVLEHLQIFFHHQVLLFSSFSIFLKRQWAGAHLDNHGLLLAWFEAQDCGVDVAGGNLMHKTLKALMLYSCAQIALRIVFEIVRSVLCQHLFGQAQL